jgi:hypothetical protein
MKKLKTPPNSEEQKFDYTPNDHKIGQLRANDSVNPL